MALLRLPPSTNLLKPMSSSLPARDRVIDFGKHKGRMLGALPSKYLTWVSKNLRARDFHHWANLADEVLRDPVYRDRIEWEAAERLLTGEGLRSNSPTAEGSPVSELLEISERFGWDNEDKEGWKKVDFELLGTSRGGRIPRKSRNGGGFGEISRTGDSDNKSGRVGFLSRGQRVVIEEEKGKREERRDRQRVRREQQMRVLRREVGDGGGARGERKSGSGGGGVVNPFPGRGALLDKIKRPPGA